MLLGNRNGFAGVRSTIKSILDALTEAVASLRKKKMPLYPLGSGATLSNGVLTIDPFSMASYTPSANAAFSISVGNLPADLESGKARDTIFVIDCTSLTDGQEPTVTWSEHFHPRTDILVDFACTAGVKNVYYVTEFTQGEFLVAMWNKNMQGGSVIVDDELSPTSENPVQNKVIYEAIGDVESVLAAINGGSET